VLQSFFNAYFNLGVKAIIMGIDRGTDNTGKARVNQFLTAYDQKNTMLSGVIF
jgi:hypothetical protein